MLYYSKILQISTEPDLVKEWTFMKITALVENRTNRGLNVRHGLSLYIETAKHKILFDVGPDNTLFENCEKLGVDLLKVDTVVLSHGHYDHGGALEQFLKINNSAKIYAQKKAFDPHYAKRFFVKKDISVDPGLKTRAQMRLLNGDHQIDDELFLFTTPDISKYRSGANDTLYSAAGKDDFSHEQSLMVLGDTNVLIMGCGHAGIVNILEKASAYKPQVCVGGYHLWNPVTKKTVPDKLLDGIAQELAKYNIRYYTCHCTGSEAHGYLAGRLPDMNYLSCGGVIQL